MNKPLFSVIIPVYKIKQELLNNCLSSLLKQDYDGVEYLIIDDGSPDDCGEICDSYGEKDSRITVFHIANAGVSNARNFGIKHSRGKYILFLDGDDFFVNGFLGRIAEIATIENNDILFYKHISRVEDKLIPLELPSDTGKLIEGVPTDVIANAIVSNKNSDIGIPDILFGAPWGKVFSAEYISKNKIEFPLGIKKSQDRIFMLKALSFNPKISITDMFGYVYVTNTASICRRYNTEIIKIADDAAECFKDTIDNYYDTKSRIPLMSAYNYLILDFFFIITQLYFFNSEHKVKPEDKVLFVKVCNERKKYFKNCSGKGLKKKRKLVLAILKTGLYKPLYVILKRIYHAY